MLIQKLTLIFMAQQMSPVDYTNLPAISPPAGIVPDFEHGETRAKEAYIGMGICLGISLIFMLLRFYVKLYITHLWGWDDGEFRERELTILVTNGQQWHACLAG